MATKYTLTHVKHEPLHCLTPGLFRSVSKGDRKKYKLDITYEYSDRESIRFIGFEPLGADDMRFLQGLVALSGPDGITLSVQPKDTIPKQLRLNLNFDKESEQHQTGLVVKDSITHLLYEIGLSDCGDNIKALTASLTRMSNVTIIYKTANLECSYHMLSYLIDTNDRTNKKLHVALNPKIAEAVLGVKNHIKIDLKEVRQIKKDPTRLIHQRLCAWINPGKNGKVTIDTLCDYVWMPTTVAGTNSKRRNTMREALNELRELNWTVTEYVKNKYDIHRPL